MPAVKDTAICIRHWDWSETSQTVSLFTANHGVIRGLAKGSRRERSVFSGGIELLTRGEVLFLSKSGGPGTGLTPITAWDLQEPYSRLRSSLGGLNAGIFLADLVQHGLEDHDPHPAVFSALDTALALLANGSAPLRVVLMFLWKLLSDTGYRPDVWSDPRSGTPIPNARVYEFSPKFGGLLAPPPPTAAAPESPVRSKFEGPESSAHRAHSAGGETWKVRPDTVEVLRRVGSRDETLDWTGIVADTSLPEEAVVRATGLLASYFRFIHRAWPPSIRWVLPDLVRS
ncbi:MAG: DNA repair protein RecO [Phycisphaerales bacterium]|nr:DNA repair protein RecO [Phycisphaerales bacterium]